MSLHFYQTEEVRFTHELKVIVDKFVPVHVALLLIIRIAKLELLLQQTAPHLFREEDLD